MKSHVQNIIGLALILLTSFSQLHGQIIADGIYQIYSETHDAIVESPVDVNQDDSGDGTINNLFGSTSDINNDYQLFEFIHQGDDVYKIKNLGTEQFIGIKDNWCGNDGEVIARFEETDSNTEFSVSQDETTGQFIIQIAFTTCNFGSVNDPSRSFDLGSATGRVRTFGDTGGNQQFRLLNTSPVLNEGIYHLFSEVNNEALASPINPNQDDSEDGQVNNLFATAIDATDDYQQFEFSYQYTNGKGDIYKIKNLGTNLFVGLKDNWCGNNAEVIARFNENDTNVKFSVTLDESTGNYLFSNSFGADCNEFSPSDIIPYFDLAGGDSGAKIRTFADTGANQQFRVTASESLFVYNNTWSPSVPLATGGEDVFISGGTFSTSDDVSFNSVSVFENATFEVSPTDVLSVEEFISNDGTFVFKSNDSGSGQLAEFNGRINGAITAERFIPARRAFRFLSSSVGGVDIANSWQLNTHITGSTDGSNGFDETATGLPSMFTYNHSIETQNQPWLPIASTNQDIVAGRPYRLFIRGNRGIDLENNSAPANDVTLSATGNLFTGNRVVTTSDFASNFTFVGNPYQAIVNLNSLSFGDDVNSNFAYYWDPSLESAGGFVVVTLPGGAPNPGSSNANHFLRPGQAVFIRNNDSGSDFGIEFTESSKATTGSQTQVFSDAATSFVNVRLYTTHKLTNGEAEEDAFGLRFYENGNNAIDQMDAVKMGNPGVNLASVNGNTPLAIESRALPDANEEIQLFVNNLSTADYTFRFHSENLPENIKVFINDAYLETKTEIEGGIDTFNFSVDTNIEASISAFRFSLTFEETTLSIDEFEAFSEVSVYPNPTSSVLHVRSKTLANQDVKVEIADVLGRNLQQFVTTTKEDATVEVNTSELRQGVYFINLSTSTGIKVTERFIKK